MKYILGLLLASCTQLPMKPLQSENIKEVAHGEGFVIYELTLDTNTYLIGKSTTQLTIK